MSAGHRVIGVAFPSTYARHIGRVGALAVALGIGVAVALPGVAYAETGTPDPGTNTANETPSGNPTPDDTPSGPTPKDDEVEVGGNNPTDIIEDDAFGDDTLGNSGGLDEQIDNDDDDLPVFDPPADEDLEDELDPSSTPDELPPVEIPASELPITPTDPIKEVDNTAGPVLTGGAPAGADFQNGSATQNVLQVHEPLNAEGDDLESFADDQPAFRTFIAPDDDTFTVSNLMQGNTITALEATPPPPAQPQPSFFDSLLAIPGTLIGGVLDVVSALLAPVIGPGGILNSPFLWGALLSVRRQFDQTFSNSTPVLQPVQTSQDLDDGQVHGTFGGADPDGDTLTYSVPARGAVGGPAHGTVTVNQAAGTWTYTPDNNGTPSNFADDYRGPDSFTVLVSDEGNGFHIHALGQTHSRAVTVGVQAGTATVNPPTPVDPLHPYTPAPQQPGDPTGTVRGTVNATDPQGLPITYTYTGPSTTTDGSTVVVNPNGSFVYKPSEEARHNAAAGIDTYTFTVTATNTGGASTDIPVTVPVGPTLNQTPTPPSVIAPVVITNHTTGTATGQVGWTDPDGDPVRYGNPDGTTATTWTTMSGGTVTIDPTTGVYTYIPDPADRHPASAADANQTGANSDKFDIIVSDGHGYTQSITVTVPIDGTNSAPVAPGTPPAGIVQDHLTGRTTGQIGYTDPDGDTLVYAGPADGKTAGGGTVTVNPNGTYVYTPDPSDRLNAYSHPAQNTDTFAVIITDSHGATQTVTVPVRVDPTNVAITVSEDFDQRADDPIFSPDGRYRYQLMYKTDPQTGDYRTIVKVTDTHLNTNKTTQPIAGLGRGIVFGDDGTVYVTVSTSESDLVTGATTSVSIVDSASGAVTTSPNVTGFALYAPVLGADGRLYVTTRAFDPDTAEALTYVSVFEGTDVTTLPAIAGRPHNSVNVGPDGRVYQVTDAFSNGIGYQTTVSVINADNTIVPLVPVSGEAEGFRMVFNGDGSRAYMLTRDYFAGKAWINTINADNNVTSAEVPNVASFPSISANDNGSTVYVTVEPTYNATRVYIIDTATGALTSTPTLVGDHFNGVQVGSDGTAYQTTSDGSNPYPNYTSGISIINDDATVTTSAALTGAPAGWVQQNPVTGDTYFLSGTGTGYTYVSIIDAETQTVTTLSPILGNPGTYGVVISPSGDRTYFTTQHPDADWYNTTVWSIDSNNTITRVSQPLDGSSRNIVFSPGGQHAYLQTVRKVGSNTYEETLHEITVATPPVPDPSLQV